MNIANNPAAIKLITDRCMDDHPSAIVIDMTPIVIVWALGAVLVIAIIIFAIWLIRR